MRRNPTSISALWLFLLSSLAGRNPLAERVVTALAPGGAKGARDAAGTNKGPARNCSPDGPLTCRYIHGQVDRSKSAERR
jgi:hypothetical protein